MDLINLALIMELKQQKLQMILGFPVLKAHNKNLLFKTAFRNLDGEKIKLK